MFPHYSLHWLPTNYFDGGHSVIVGKSAEGEFRYAIEAAGEREVTPLHLRLSVEWLGDARLGISMLLKHRITCVDSDGDGFGDPSVPDNDCCDDNCPTIYNMMQRDMDDDGIGDVCDPDIDGDDLPNESDNCPMAYNPLQENSDTDSHGDACDNCPLEDNEDQLDVDNDGLGNACDPCTCGDTDSSGGIDIDDIVRLIGYIFIGAEPPQPLESADVNCSGDIDIDDVVYFITHIFKNGPAPCDLDWDSQADC
jgi:hypothetical protein